MASQTMGSLRGFEKDELLRFHSSRPLGDELQTAPNDLLAQLPPAPRHEAHRACFRRREVVAVEDEGNELVGKRR